MVSFAVGNRTLDLNMPYLLTLNSTVKVTGKDLSVKVQVCIPQAVVELAFFIYERAHGASELKGLQGIL